MRALITLISAFFAVSSIPATAQQITVTEEWVTVETVEHTASRYVSPLHERTEQAAIAAYGPFRVIDENTAALVDITRAGAPEHFAAMLAAYPAIDTLEFVEAPGTHDDRANLRLGRMIRERGIATRVKDGGSIRSGAVELFLAGAIREIDEGSEFAVHGWLDDWGRGAEDYPADAPEHRRYLDYYMEMGMDEAQARAFYSMTNSVPFEDARWLTGSEMREWVQDASDSGQAESEEDSQPRLAYLDLEPVLQ
ncbi:hypothetical protein [Aurantiacibacter gangjinensis]|uniref:Uncharacterized protein n=1 Tax=Aurantiacibacter gangjinensis TaxID=502682 RepID=A0A0G9MKF0_9SPHN|nr:hypothetical protein [Aurantiacibacter gangjinensis]APE29466.1 hypothetical protein BMF35_b0211 [Aurantiacibacter gangjinensis]KLE31155.1 hypothetical protein AAW01_13090 [Aurantiacibacter gangjinensis]